MKSEIDILNLSGVENVHLMKSGHLHIYGLQIHPKMDGETTGQIVGIVYPPEFALQLLSFLHFNEDAIIQALDLGEEKAGPAPFEDYYPGSETYTEQMGIDDEDPRIDDDWGSENLDQQEWSSFDLEDE